MCKLEQSLKAGQIPFDYLGTTDHFPMDPRHHSKVGYSVLRGTFFKNQSAKTAGN